MEFGFFDDEHREYVITRPDTPLPWINYLGTESYLGFVSNTGGGCAFFRDAALRRITRYRHNNAPLDVGGRYIYLRDEADGDFWSPSWQPTKSELDGYECRHGMSYTSIASGHRGIHAETLYFVPLGADLEVWRLRVTNERETAAELSAFSAIEFCLWDARDDSTNYQRNFNTGEVEVVDGVIYHKTEYRERRDHFAYFACSEPLAGFDTQRDTFLGPYRGWDSPTAVERGQSFDSEAHGWSPIGSHHVRLSLAPGETREVVFVLGYAENPVAEKFDPPGSTTVNKARVLPTIAHWLKPTSVEAGLVALRSHWDGLLSALTVETPDADTNRIVNIWNQYQCMVTFNVSRSMSSYEAGIGRGMGFRDSSQDLLSCSMVIPERARQRILDLAATQLETGGAYHQYQPLTKRGNDAIGAGFNDDPGWLILATAAYMKETGDTTILDEPVPYGNEAGSEQPLYEHLQRCLRYTLERLGPHGLPLMGRADWNDCLNLNCFSETPGESFQLTENKQGGVAESVFIAGEFVLASGELAAIARLVGHEADASEYEAAGESMAATIEEHGWDGEWFLRAYDYFGDPIGTHTSKEGQIFVESQGICIMAGVGVEDGKASRALASVKTRLATEHGVVLVQPAFTSYDPKLGEITSYPPGYKENGSVFCHTNPWIVIASTRDSDGDAAFDYYRRTNPSARAAISEIHRCEPYCYAQTIAGRDAARPGEAKNSWLTGAASWNLVAISQWILGIRPELDGLRIDPVLPSSWEGITVRRRWRGATYDVTVRKPAGACGRVRSLIVDGVPFEGSLLAPAPAGSVVKVEAIIEAIAPQLLEVAQGA
ncbi:MAG: glycosyl hydrolase family 65 protein [Solirubrobacteraceae bacterium]|jgi:cellobiose phosphorylase